MQSLNRQDNSNMSKLTKRANRYGRTDVPKFNKASLKKYKRKVMTDMLTTCIESLNNSLDFLMVFTCVASLYRGLKGYDNGR